MCLYFVLLMKSHLQSYPCPLQINSFWNLGFLLGITIILQIITGIFLGLILLCAKKLSPTHSIKGRDMNSRAKALIRKKTPILRRLVSQHLFVPQLKVNQKRLVSLNLSIGTLFTGSSHQSPHFQSNFRSTENILSLFSIPMIYFS
jgi:hypothetical protein